MTKLYKLTDRNGCTRGPTQWGPGVTHTANGEGELCGPGWLHAYTNPLLAVLLNPIHANIENPRLWEAEGEVGKSDRGLKVGTRKLTTIREIPFPIVTTEQRVKFAILCAKQVCKNPAWNKWADAWLDGSDRTEAAAAWGSAELAASAAKLAASAKLAARSAKSAAWSAELAASASEASDIDLIAIAEEACR